MRLSAGGKERFKYSGGAASKQDKDAMNKEYFS